MRPAGVAPSFADDALTARPPDGALTVRPARTAGATTARGAPGIACRVAATVGVGLRVAPVPAWSGAVLLSGLAGRMTRPLAGPARRGRGRVQPGARDGAADVPSA